MTDGGVGGLGLWVAAYAVVVSTLALGWNVYVARRDRADVRVSFERAILYAAGKAVDNLVTVTAANRGRRPVTLMSYGFQLSNGERLTPIPYPLWPLPKKLEEGESYTNCVTLRSLQEALCQQAPGARITALVFRSADRRTFRCPVSRRSGWHKLLGGPHVPEPTHKEALDPLAAVRAAFHVSRIPTATP